MAQLLQKIRTLMSPPPRLRSAIEAFGSTVLVTSVIVTGVIGILRQVGTFEGSELSVYDSLMRSRPAEGLDERVLVVGITEEDIQRRMEFPLHDGTLAELLQKLNVNQPRAIGIDIVRDFPQGSGREVLIQELTAGEHIIATCVLSSSKEPSVPPPPGVPPERVGFAELPQDPNGVIRRSYLVSTPTPFGGVTLQESICSNVDPTNELISLSFALSLLYLEQEEMVPALTNQGIQIGPTVFSRLSEQAGGYHNNGATDYQIMLNYRLPQDIRQVSLTKVLTGQVNPDWIRDRVVLIGYTSQIAKDTFFTPFSADSEDVKAMPGVVIHAHSVSQILSAVLDNRPLIWYWSQGGEILWILAWSLLGGSIAWRTRKTLLFLLLEGGAIAALIGLCDLFFLYSGWVPLVPPAIALIASAFGVILVDRANKSGYTQALYDQVKEQVKGALKPKIEIDQEKRVKQVAEITETGYFQDLVQRAKVIREQRARGQRRELDTQRTAENMTEES